MTPARVIPLIMLLVTLLPRHCDAHGRLMDPPARNSMWRLGFNNPVNYNDNELYCGGRMVQWLRNSGKCGVCGDPYHGKNDHLAGGKYANGIITRSFHEGDEMPVTVHLTANHLGWFEFRICPVNDPKKMVTQKCLDQNELERADGKGTKYFVPKGKYNAFFNYTLVLPKGLTCKQCVVQWKYRTGNTWDKDDKSGLFCLGCGPQEEFYNCADVEILPKGEKSKWSKEQNMRPTTTTSAPTKPPKVQPIKIVVDTTKDKPKKIKDKKKNMVEKYKKTTLPAPASKGPAGKNNHPISSENTVNSSSRKKSKVKHPQDAKYNWRASTPWLMRRKYLNRRRLGLKRRLQKNPNVVQKKPSSGGNDPKVQNEPDTKTTAQPKTTKSVKTTTSAPITKTTTTRRTAKPTAKPTKPPTTTRRQYRPSPKPQQRVTKMKTTVTKPPRNTVIKSPSKTWLIGSQRQSPFKRPVKPSAKQPSNLVKRPPNQKTRQQVLRTTRRPIRKTQPPRPTPKRVSERKTTAHNCITETPDTKPLRKAVQVKTPVENTARPRMDDTRPPPSRGKQYVTPVQQQIRPSQRSRGQLQQNRGHPQQNRRQPQQNRRQPQQNRGQPQQNQRQSQQNRGQPQQNQRQSQQNRGQPQQNQRHSQQNRGQPQQNQRQSQQNRGQPQQNQRQSQQNRGQPQQNRVQNGHQPSRPVSQQRDRQYSQQRAHQATRPVSQQRGHQQTRPITQQRVISFQPVVPQQNIVNQPVLDQRQIQLPRQGTRSYTHTDPMNSVWWNQYQRPVSYFWNRPPVAPILKCRATITLGGGMDEWCTANCNANFCPGGMCICQAEQSYPSYSMFPQQSQGWGNTYSPALSQFNTNSRPVSQTSHSLSPFAPRRHLVQRTRTPRKLSPAHQVSEQAPIRQVTQQREITVPQPKATKSTEHTSRNTVHDPSTTSVSISPPRRRTSSSVWGQKGKYFCRATGRYAGLKRFDEWCSNNCMNVICPLLICECNSL